MLVLAGAVKSKSTWISGYWQAAAIAAGIVLGAWYLFTMLRRVFFGPVKEPHTHGAASIADLNFRELTALAPLAALCVALGVYPQPVLEVAKRDIAVISRILDDAHHRTQSSETRLTDSR
jgi:NADH-quinone oxidoreductase subunit M